MKYDIFALLGQRQALADGVVDYCTQLEQAMAEQNIHLKLVWMPWKERGWVRSLTWLWQESQTWQGKWVIVQYTAAAWSKLALPILFILMLQLLRIRKIRVAIMFHEVQGYPGDSIKSRIRRAVQLWIIRTAMRMTDKSILNVSLDRLTWLPVELTDATFIPVGSNMPEPDPEIASLKSAQLSGEKVAHGQISLEFPPEHPKTVAVFGMTSLEITPEEVKAIAHAIGQASQKIPHLHLVTLGRGSKEAEKALRDALQGVNVDISVLGMLEPEEITQTLVKADVMLFVRGEICSRKTTAIAGLSCGLPIVSYVGTETAHPIPEAGVLLVPEGDREALASALIDVLQDRQLWLELHKRSLEVYKNYFAWDAIAKRFIEELNL